jgi:hypothetical protein
MARYLVIALLISVLLHGTAVSQTTYVVKDDGSGDAPTIKAAIEMAVSGDAISVWGGTYNEDSLIAGDHILVLPPGDGHHVQERRHDD